MRTGPTLLIAEDEENDIFLIQRAFRSNGLSGVIQTVRDGEQAISYLGGTGMYANREKFPFPFLMLTDLKMPKASGLDILKYARQDLKIRSLPIVILSSSVLLSDLERAYELGANSYITKPADFKTLAEKLKVFQTYWFEVNAPTPFADAD